MHHVMIDTEPLSNVSTSLPMAMHVRTHVRILLNLITVILQDRADKRSVYMEGFDETMISSLLCYNLHFAKIVLRCQRYSNHH